ncbi:hypothetical protein [Desulfofustis limnaeus]|jgi:hypothetical protein|uniref:Uncharacterized protein n=1 Tax=Desulfofustis limnaeus TaxID=2740163 RepID=A0ABN6M3S3_9BACT|nr:hypothetical protein [Desulfofustis limnaeus]MDX9894607.1 hypothetical protein [Desulfofustis sp.]BDD86248.1 hypothetical protein DPPLL_06130 [Desulfofustis limnaeus]
MAATYLNTASNVSLSPVLIGERWREKTSEYFWFSVCFALFLVLGPFAAPIALGFVFSNHSINADAVEPRRLDE